MMSTSYLLYDFCDYCCCDDCRLNRIEGLFQPGCETCCDTGRIAVPFTEVWGNVGLVDVG